MVGRTDGEKAVDDYLVGIAEQFRQPLEQLRRVIREEAPDAVETISYGIPTFRLDGNLVHFAAFRNHMSFFPGSTAHNEALKEELAGFKLAKGTIQFTLGKPLPDDLVRRIVRLRIAENGARVTARKAAKPAK